MIYASDCAQLLQKHVQETKIDKKYAMFSRSVDKVV